MGYAGQNPGEFNPNEFNELDRRMAQDMLAQAKECGQVSVDGVMRLAHLESVGKSIQAQYYLKELGSIVCTAQAIDLRPAQSDVADLNNEANVYTEAWDALSKWQNIANNY